MTEDASFESLDRDGEVGPGPSAILLCGLDPASASVIEALLRDSGVESSRLVFCTEAMLHQPLGAALEAHAEDETPLPPDALPRVVVLSGMSGRQIHEVIDGWRGAGLPAPIWASTTPNNLAFPLRGLLRELLAEQRAMAQRREG